MISTTDGLNTKEFKSYFIIYPSYKKNINLQNITNYSSDKNKKFLSSSEIKNIIKKNINNFEPEIS